ncbi:hypothetical protein CHELA40_10395 [Chelatococcus asaccharovorans]|nr:hypothetical protein CHELA40_10395 [Chelatococcus asaccharovorans]CAH1686735.1 hypothetical protein CHELA17_65212 [Chelatococcus asaccharovorans]
MGMTWGTAVADPSPSGEGGLAPSEVGWGSRGRERCSNGHAGIAAEWVGTGGTFPHPALAARPSPEGEG